VPARSSSRTVADGVGTSRAVPMKVLGGEGTTRNHVTPNFVAP
jgi:hypothetical protein